MHITNPNKEDGEEAIEEGELIGKWDFFCGVESMGNFGGIL